MKRNVHRTLLGVIVSLALLLSACSANKPAPAPSQAPAQEGASKTEATSTPQGEKIVHIGIVNAPITLNQINDQGDSASDNVLALLNDSLLDLNEKFEFIPKLAQSVETADNQTFVVKLDPAAKWNDNTPFTTADVAFTLKLALHPKVETNFRLNFIEGLNDTGKLEEGVTEISGLHIVDDHTFEVKTKTKIDPLIFKERFGTKVFFLPQHILKDVNPEQLATHPYFQKPEVTIGAFKFGSFVKGQYAEVVKNPSYYRAIAKLDKIFIKVLPAANLVAQLQTGEIHMNSIPVGLIPITDYEKVTGFSNVELTSGNSSVPPELFFNAEKISDPKVRQAFAYALNRSLIVDQLLKGQGEIIDGGIPSYHPYYNKEITNYSYDPEKAKQLLKEANWDSSKPVSFLIPVGNKIREQAADILVQNLTDVGIKVDVQKFDFATLIQKVLKGDYDVTIFTRDFYIEPSSYFTLFKGDNPGNFLKYKNPEVDTLIAQGEAESDPAKRHDIYNRLQAILHEDVPSLAVYSEKRLLAVSSKVSVGKPLDIGMFNNVNEWDLNP
ncbi:ABC transporter substrate-binding protein [Paenibacillus radicis (ex Gao et al. 2016)]|uniref:ABC transporter substrate-binding protein n=1 Tax=Paenibacillus radicis (ex Gao et al. 2016) TaxID=1737354 RepID=A0A917H9U7_9BACL|nr:ABC transporter substrate-binding protein [Paenibacillus radicis (ex Gao et al. 2016)]GGG72317.1 ABC transporter substrate-binding protein [Paenibacillus radicis (ex Gao et al. 2016)]